MSTVSPCSILIVDPDPTVAETLARIFEAAGYQAAFVHDEHSAEDAVRSFAPDLVLTEARFEDHDALELIERLSELPCHKVIVLTHRLTPALNASLDRLGTTRCIVLEKPIHPHKLLSVAAALLAKPGRAA